MSEERLEQSFAVDSPAVVTLKNIRGLIEVSPGELDKVQITAVKHLETGDAERTEVRMIQDSDGEVLAKVKYADSISGWLGIGNKPCRVDFLVQVPVECELKAESVSGNVRVQGLQGDLHIRTVSGNAALKDLSGDLTVNSVSGKVTAERLDGILQLKQVSGDTTLLESQLASISANMVSGDIKAETALHDGPYDFKSVSGGVKLIVPEGTQSTMTLSSLSGKIRAGNGVTNERSSGGHGRKKRLVEVNGGGVEVHMNSVSGNLRMEIPGGDLQTQLPRPQTQEVSSMEPAATEPESVQQVDRLNVLDQVGKGELTVEEAMRLLSEE